MNINILICSAGRRVSLVSYFQAQARKQYGNAAKVYTSDLDPKMAPACRISDGAIPIGRFSDPNYIDTLLEVCTKYQIGLLIPTIDTELALLANNRSRFEQQGICVIVSTPALVAACSNKRKTISLFEELDFFVPRPIDIHKPQYPFFAKPINGSSSNDIFLIKDSNYLSNYVCDTNKFLHQEYLAPEHFEEYTVDLYYDRSSTLKCAVPRLRIATRGGEVAKGMTVRNAVYDFVLRKLNTLTGAIGCITLQVFLEKKSDKVFGIEFNARFGGGYPLSYLAGANYPQMLIDEHLMGKQIEFFDEWEEGLLLLRHDHEMIVHATSR